MVLNTSQHPQSNGLVEKFNSTLKSMINKTILEDGQNWHKYINKNLFAVQTSTKISPFEAMYVRKPVLPNEMMHGHTELSNVAKNEEVDLENEVEKLKAVKETNENRMMDNINQAKTRQKKYYK